MNSHANVPVLRGCANVDGTACRRMAHGVIDQVGEDLLQPPLIPLYGWQRRGHGQSHRGPALLRLPLESARADAEEILEIETLALDQRLAGLEPREVDEVVDEAAHALGLLVDDAARFSVFLG